MRSHRARCASAASYHLKVSRLFALTRGLRRAGTPGSLSALPMPPSVFFTIENISLMETKSDQLEASVTTRRALPALAEARARRGVAASEITPRAKYCHIPGQPKPHSSALLGGSKVCGQAGGDLKMQKTKRRAKLFGSDRAREWTTDFLIGLGMFLLVAFFASTHTKPALPAPLAKTQASLEQSMLPASEPVIVTKTSMPSSQSSSLTQMPQINGSSNNLMMVFMALVFSTLLTLTIQFWRNLRREYASPRRKWGKG